VAIKKNTKKKKTKKRKPLPPFSESVWRSKILDTDPMADERVSVKRRVKYENELDFDPTDPIAEIISKPKRGKKKGL
jgi:hypothetical protein